VDLGVVGQAAGMFAVTNIDGMLVLALFFGQTGSGRAGVTRVVVGQYLGFAAILIASIVGAMGAGLLPASAIPYGVAAAGVGCACRLESLPGARHQRTGPRAVGPPGHPPGPGISAVATVTLANGGDNIGVSVFAVAGASGMTVYVVVFLIGVAIWCADGHFVATRPLIAKALSRWGHILMPVVLIGIGALILIEGGAFGP
jgi:cadmium resistance protein CadD (predicted permease)